MLARLPVAGATLCLRVREVLLNIQGAEALSVLQVNVRTDGLSARLALRGSALEKGGISN